MPTRRRFTWTSREAYRTLNLSLTDKHQRLLDMMTEPMTDDELAAAGVDAGLYERHEQGRRAVRTMRENHQLLVPYFPPGSTEQGVRRNASGRYALLWRKR
jgi:hypothetical protein